MFAYWLMLCWVMFVGIYVKNHSSVIVVGPDGVNDYYTPTSMCWVVMLIPFIICFCRSGFVDTWGYVSGFKTLPDMATYVATYTEKKSCQLFYGLETIFKYYIIDNYHAWFFLIAAVQIGCMIKVLRKYSVDISISFFLFIASGMIFSWMFNGIKQFIAATILFALTDWILEKKYLKYFLVVIFVTGLGPLYSILGWGEPPWFLCGFHESAIIMIPIIFCANGKAFNKRMWFLLVFLVALAATGFLGTFLEISTENTAYSDDLQYIGENTGMSIARFLVSVVPVVLVFLRRQTIMNENTPPIISLSINMSVVSAAIYFLATITSGIFIGRLPIYCELYNLILYPWLIHHAYREEKSVLIPTMYILFIIYFIYQMYVAFGEPYYSDVLKLISSY